MRILGIDPGTATTGFGVIEKHGSILKFVDAGVITTSPEISMPNRLVTIHEEISQVICETKPDQVAIELLYFASNVTTGITVGQARGVLLMACAEAGLPISEYTPLQVKQAITGYGKADKKQIQEMVKMILKLSAIPRPDDAADGLAIAITHSHQLTLSTIPDRKVAMATVRDSGSHVAVGEILHSVQNDNEGTGK